MTPFVEVVVGGALVIIGADALRDAWRRRSRWDIVLKSADWGEVYVLQDVLSPKLLKVGVTKRSASIRGREVSADMTGGRELRCRHVVHMPFASSVEKEAHRLLARHNEYSERGTEWFRVGDPSSVEMAVDKAARTVRRVAKRRRRWTPEAEADFRSMMRQSESTSTPFMVRSNRRASHGRA